MPDQEQLLTEISSLKQSLATQQCQIEQLRQNNAELAAANEQLHSEIEAYKQREADLRQSRDVLQGSEEKYKTLVETLPDAVIMADMTGHATFVSRRFLELHRADSVDEFMGKTAWDFIVPEDHEKAQKYYQNTLKEGITKNAELSFFRMDGTRFTSELSAAVVKDASGKAVAIINVLRDISERKQAEQALRQSEHRFRNYFEQSLIGMAATTLDGHWIIANDRICEILGYPREELFQRTWPELTHPEDLAKDYEQFNRLLKNEIENYTLEKRFVRKDGSVVYTTINIRAFRKEDGTIDHIVGLMEDITARKEAEEALRHSHDELKAIYDGMVEGLLVTDIETKRFVRVNPSICRMLGYSEEELLATSVKDIHPPEEVPNDLLRFQAAAEGQVTINEDRPVLRKDGSIFNADITSHRVFCNGRPCLLALFRDITERKQAEEALQREYRTLKHLLQSSDHERQSIAYEIHDGLAQYLASAIMQFDVYKHQLEKKPNDAAKAYDSAMTLLRQGHTEARRLIAGIRHPVLDEAGVVEAVAHLINEQNRRKGPRIDFHSLVDFSRLVPLLENAIYRIIQEGMTNACKYSQSSRVRVTLLQQKDRLRIEIRDWGIGFDTKNVKEGSYGLTGIRERARLLGGKYRLQSVLGKGTRIVVILPLMEREE